MAVKNSSAIQQEIEKLQEELKAAKEYERSLESGSPYALAQLLHNKTCLANHIDGCSWEYETWDSPGYAHTSYLDKAERMLSSAKNNGITPVQLVKVLGWL